MYSTAECVVYTMKRSLPPARRTLSPQFVAAVQALPLKFSLETVIAFVKFVERFGTHFAETLDLGASASAYNRFNQHEFETSVNAFAKLDLNGKTGATAPWAATVSNSYWCQVSGGYF